MLLTTTFRGLEFRVQGLGKGFNSRLLECFGLSTGALLLLTGSSVTWQLSYNSYITSLAVTG